MISPVDQALLLEVAQVHMLLVLVLLVDFELLVAEPFEIFLLLFGEYTLMLKCPLYPEEAGQDTNLRIFL